MVCIPTANNACAPQTAPSVEELLQRLGLSTPQLQLWLEKLEKKLKQVREAMHLNGGHIEEVARQGCRELERILIEQAMQDRAEAVPVECPHCTGKLVRRWKQKTRPIRTLGGTIQFERFGGYCKRCDRMQYPADHSLGLLENSTASPLVQEVSALLVSKMPAEQAEAISLRVCGIQLSRATLGREAQRQGNRAIAQLTMMNHATSPLLSKTLPGETRTLEKPFTLVIQIDAWNIRERDHWNQTQAMREKGEDFSRWHWVYTGTCFRLDQRCVKGKQRAVITERSYVATRAGIEPMIKHLHAEAMRRGLGRAQRVLVIADGAVWIWNAVSDRFPEAVQRLDLWHGNSYLWAVANELHGNGTREARAWVKPLLKKLRQDKTLNVIQQLQELLPQLKETPAEVVTKTVEYYTNHLERMKYAEGQQLGEPVGSGAIESTCRQFQCRMKRCGQFWSQAGDEALLTLETFWRNGYWEKLFPHAQLTSVSQN
jgi:predicted membrane protein